MHILLSYLCLKYGVFYFEAAQKKYYCVQVWFKQDDYYLKPKVCLQFALLTRPPARSDEALKIKGEECREATVFLLTGQTSGQNSTVQNENEGLVGAPNTLLALDVLGGGTGRGTDQPPPPDV